MTDVIQFPVRRELFSVDQMLEDLVKRHKERPIKKLLLWYEVGGGDCSTWRSVMSDRDHAYALAILHHDLQNYLHGEPDG